MSRATVEQALTGLIPTLNGPLPPELVELAVSLLARSRSVAHSLKPDEEIARPYACAQLACERLKKRLNLPAIASRPPCPPKIYKKLYKYLESALPSTQTSSAPQTPRKNRSEPSTSARTTPKTPLSGRKTPRSVAKDNGSANEVQDWVMPTIRALAKAFDTPSAAPHVYTGVESILPLLARMTAAAQETPSKRPRRAAAVQANISDVSESKILALVAVIFFYVLSRMADQDITPEQFEEWRNKAVATLLRSRTVVDEEDILAEVESLMPTAQEEGWLQMEWFLNVYPVDDGEEMEGVEMSGGSIAQGKTKGLRDLGSEYIGLGTMMQDATDYLSERHRAEYKRWEAQIMSRIEAIETG
ncbi:origin recognition complex, subunit 6 [Lophiotrema nucula]|uniref:Origin recognition complex, subunit 6 n=1 Tax=Lophiotrema nucula TaxID=690887 RepID=A0A6A5ZRY4_9PLEO|nr:origin recognition complex, subunit 6 [Lophiotrema nucula]